MIESKNRTALLAVLVGLPGSTALAGTSAAAAANARHVPAHHTRHAKHARHHHQGIPQHNQGDHDSDNNGAPSDGDGNQ